MRAIIRNDAPAVKVRNVDAPFFRTSFGPSVPVSTISGNAGVPIGLLLALTYAGTATQTFIGENPSINEIRTTDIPTFRARYSGILLAAVPAVNFAGAGYLIGMLALTYSKVQTIPAVPAVFKSDEVPNVRIRTTD